MPGTFAYDEATDKIVVTDGTSGAPATFNDMYTADQVGIATELLAAEAGTSAPGNSLTYAIRPTHDKALVIKCIVAGKTPEADFIFITGTDAWGAAQTESIDVTAGNGIYTTTKRFATATEFDCSDNAAGGGVQWADGTIQVTQDIWGVIWEFAANAQYQIDCDVDFGDGSTPTYFTSDAEFVYWTTNIEWRVKAPATLKVHRSGWNTWIDGGNWGAGWSYSSNGILTASLMNWRSSEGCSEQMRGITLENCIMCDVSTISPPNVGVIWADSANSIKNLYVHGFGWGAWFNENAAVDGFIAEDCSWGVYTNAAVDVSVKGIEFINSISADVRMSTAVGQTLTLKDSVTSPSTVVLVHASDTLVEQYTCNIHITNKNGADLQSVDVDCEYAHLVEGTDSKTYKCIQDHTAVDATHKPITGSNWDEYWELFFAAGGLGGDWNTGFPYKAAAEEFSTATTDANGDISEQVIQYKKWVGTSELLEARIHKFTFSHASYPDFLMNDVIVDHPLVWEIDMGQSTSDLQAIVAGELATYDPPTRTELTSDKAAIITEVDANEAKIDALL